MKKIILVYSYMHNIVESAISDKYYVINKNKRLSICEVMDYINEVNPVVEGIVIVDQIFSQWEESERSAFYLLADYVSKQNTINILILTNDYTK